MSHQEQRLEAFRSFDRLFKSGFNIPNVHMLNASPRFVGVFAKQFLENHSAGLHIKKHGHVVKIKNDRLEVHIYAATQDSIYQGIVRLDKHNEVEHFQVEQEFARNVPNLDERIEQAKRDMFDYHSLEFRQDITDTKETNAVLDFYTQAYYVILDAAKLLAKYTIIKHDSLSNDPRDLRLESVLGENEAKFVSHLLIQLTSDKDHPSQNPELESAFEQDYLIQELKKLEQEKAVEEIQASHEESDTKVLDPQPSPSNKDNVPENLFQNEIMRLLHHPDAEKDFLNLTEKTKEELLEDCIESLNPRPQNVSQALESTSDSSPFDSQTEEHDLQCSESDGLLDIWNPPFKEVMRYSVSKGDHMEMHEDFMESVSRGTLINFVQHYIREHLNSKFTVKFSSGGVGAECHHINVILPPILKDTFVHWRLTVTVDRKDGISETSWSHGSTLNENQNPSEWNPFEDDAKHFPYPSTAIEAKAFLDKVLALCSFYSTVKSYEVTATVTVKKKIPVFAQYPTQAKRLAKKELAPQVERGEVEFSESSSDFWEIKRN